MPYRLRAKESVPDGIKRVVSEEIDSAGALLRERSPKQRDEAVHEARKSVKKIRGVLRIVRPELGKTFKEENSRFGEVGRRLSRLRDAAALLEVFDQIVNKYGVTFDGKGASAIRLGLEKLKDEIEARLNVSQTAERAAGALHSARSRIGKWPLAGDGFSILSAGLERTYRDGRKAMGKAGRKQNAVCYHEFRKRVKDHWYHVRLLESIWTEVMQAHEASLKELETWLGDDHNCVVLREKLEANPDAFGGAQTVEVFLLLVGKHQEELREKSSSLGARVYAEKPREFVRNIAALWDTWQKQPDSMKDVEKADRENPPKKPVKASGKKAKSTAAA